MSVGGACFLGIFGSHFIIIHVLWFVWKNNIIRMFCVFCRTLVVEKNLLYNMPMGKQRRRSTEFKNNSQVIDIEEARKKRQAKREAEREREIKKALYEASQKTRGKKAIRKRQLRRMAMIVIIAVCIIGVMVFSVFNVISLKKEEYEVKKQTEALQQQKKELEQQLENIDDPDNLEQQARDQLRLIKPGEVLYMFPEEITNKNSDGEEQKE